MSVLPISEELNDILVQILQINWTARISLIDLRAAVEGVSTFYADHVIFEGSLAKCPWEAGVDLGNETVSNPPVKKRPVPPIPEEIDPYGDFLMSPITSLENCASIMDISVRHCWQSYSDPETSNVRGVYDDEPGTPYESSARSSSCSSDLSTPATPCSVNQGNHDFARVKLDATYGRQRHGHGKIGFTSFQPSSWEEEEESDEEHRFTYSFMATSASRLDSDTRPRDNYRTRKRCSMPNPSVCAPPEPLVSRFSSDSDNISPVQSYQMSTWCFFKIEISKHWPACQWRDQETWGRGRWWGPGVLKNLSCALKRQSTRSILSSSYPYISALQFFFIRFRF